jgi:hypothetical protein
MTFDFSIRQVTIDDDNTITCRFFPIFSHHPECNLKHQRFSCESFSRFVFVSAFYCDFTNRTKSCGIPLHWIWRLQQQQCRRLFFSVEPGFTRSTQAGFGGRLWRKEIFIK